MSGVAFAEVRSGFLWIIVVHENHTHKVDRKAVKTGIVPWPLHSFMRNGAYAREFQLKGEMCCQSPHSHRSSEVSVLVAVGRAPITCRVHPSNTPKLVLKAQSPEVPSGEVVCGLSEITVNNSAESPVAKRQLAGIRCHHLMTSYGIVCDW